ncbi:MAG: hypothetical protein ACHQAR_04840 [Steroidobacterales bacterium]
MSNHLRRIWDHYRGSQGLWRELLTLLACLAIGVIVMPCLIWLVGRAALGPYTHGGVFALWRDFLLGLAEGSSPFWIVALGPYALLWLLRGGRRLLT